MKILTNKKYGELVGEIKSLEMNLNEERRKNGKLRSEIEQMSHNFKACENRIQNLQAGYKGNVGKMRENIKNLEEEKKKLLGAKGGYVKEINKLKKKIEELEEKLKESMTDKYLVKKIPSGRRPKGPAMKLKDCSRISNISRKVFKND